jgi:hypothetical protein
VPQRECEYVGAWHFVRVNRGADMIVCSCTLITSKDIAEAIVGLRGNDPLVVITPALIYRHLGRRPSCGNCIPLITWATSMTTAIGPSVISKSEMKQVTVGL